MIENQNTYHTLIINLKKFIFKFHLRDLISGSIIVLGVISILSLSLIVLNGLFNFSSNWRTFFVFSFIIISLFTFIQNMGKTLLIFLGVLPKLDHEKAAIIIGDLYPEIGDKLLNVLQLKKEENNEIIIASIHQKISGFKITNFSTGISFQLIYKNIKWASLPIILYLIIAAIQPQFLKDGTKKLIRYDQQIEIQNPYEYTFLDYKPFGLKNEPYQITIEFKGNKIPNNPQLNFQNQQFRLKKISQNTFQYLFRNPQENLKFSLDLGEFTSKDYLVDIIGKPSISDLNVQLNFPKYTNKENLTVNGNGNVVVPEGTKISWKLSTEYNDYLGLKIRDSILTPQKNNTYNWFCRNNEKYEIICGNAEKNIFDTVAYNITVIKDEHPNIIVKNYQDSINPFYLFFTGKITDDYGFTSLNFVVEYTDSSKNKSIDINPQTTQQEFYFNINLKDYLKNETSANYYFIVYDNDAVNRPKSTRTQKINFELPQQNVLDKILEENQEEIKQNLDESLKDALALQKEFEDIKKSLLQKENLDWNDKAKIQEFIQKQKTLDEQLNDLNKKNQINNYQKESFSEEEKRIAEKQEKINQLFEELMDDETKKLYEELEKLLEEFNKDKVNELMEEINLSNEELEKELDRTLELYKQIEFEEKLEQTTEKLEKLSEQQEELSEKEKDLTDEQKIEEQNKIDEAFKEIQKDIEDLNKKNEELENKNNFDQKEENQKNIEEQLKDAKENLEKKSNKKAQKAQKNAAEEMKKLAAEMKNMQAQMAQEQQMEDMNSLKQILDNLLYLSFEQEKLIGDFKSINQFDPQYAVFAKKQGDLRDQAKIIEDSLQALSKRQIALESIINKEILEINYNMSKTINYLTERNTYSASMNQQFIMTSANNLALILDESLQQMQNQMKSQMEGSASCNKPGGNPNSMQNTKKMQQMLSKQIEEMKKQMEQGNKKGEDGKKGEKGMAKSLAKMAAEQQAIKEQLKQINQEQEKQGKGGMGQLDELEKLLEENERDILNKTITQETILRQNQIMEKLLEAENALKERELDNERIANKPKTEFIRNPKDFVPYKRLELSEEEELKTALPLFKIYFKRKVSDYFNKFGE